MYFILQTDVMSDPNPSKASINEVRMEMEQESGRLEAAIHRFIETLDIATCVHSVLNTLMNPTEELGQQPSVLDILYNSEAQDGQSKLFASFWGVQEGLLSSESQYMIEIMLQVAQCVCPQCFESIEENDDDSRIQIFQRFVKEIVENKSIDKLAALFEEDIKKNVTDLIYQELLLSFVKGVVQWLKYIATDNPCHDPLNKYVNITNIYRIWDLQKWLKDNQTHQEYDSNQAEFSCLKNKVNEARMKAMQEFKDYLLTMNKKLNPELSSLQTRDEVDAYRAEKDRVSKRQKFNSLVLKCYYKADVFEPNHLRRFWEYVNRFELGQIFYDYVCESFSPDHCQSEEHKQVRRIWALSCLDTIHDNPSEARSAMPNASTDGKEAQNFGYRMPTSQMYLGWVSHCMARGSGDVVVDAFHWTVDFGETLNIDDFLDRLSTLHHDPSSCVPANCLDKFMHPFRHFLHRKLYGYDFKKGSKLQLYDTLEKKAGSEKALLDRARESLIAFKEFAKKMLSLRPDGVRVDSFRSGLVLGIGFNGKLFGASPLNHNEIWLSLSESGRVEGGNLLLTFLRRVATLHDKVFTDTVKIFISSDGTKNQNDFSRYKALIQHHVSSQVKLFYEVPDNEWNSAQLNYITKKRNEYEGFLSQLEQDLPLNSLCHDLKQWIRNLSNWYCVPHNVKVGLPDIMKSEEYCVQEFSRRLLFDAVVQRPFSKSKDWSELMPDLFTHWKTELVNLLPEAKAIASLSEVPADLKQKVLDCLDQLVTNICPTLIQEWNVGKYGITEQFVNFMKPNVKELDIKIDRAKKDITAKEKAICKTPGNKALKEALKMANDDLRQYEDQKQKHPKEPSALSEKEYNDFYQHFFKDRNVGQCVEPVLAKVVGNDNFYSVFLSKKVDGKLIMVDNRTFQLGYRIAQDVIPPCDKNCQYHVLGHLYVRDALTPQSADHLDTLRHIHGFGAVPCRLMTAQAFQQVVYTSITNPPQVGDAMLAQPDQTTSRTDNLE